ncbi:serine protease [Streptomyces massasporeus]
MPAADTDRIDHFVLALAHLATQPDGTLMYLAHAGTAFLLQAGDGCFAMTAGHVADTLVIGEHAALFADAAGNWRAAAVVHVDRHPTQDVAVLRLEPGRYASPFTFGRSQEQASLGYTLWGYPEAILYETHVDGVAVPRPDLVYSQGHIRRRISRPVAVPEITGDRFFELSTPAGSACSGAPVLSTRPGRQWEVIGVYVGQHHSINGLGIVDLAVGYAVRTADLDLDAPDWTRYFGVS